MEKLKDYIESHNRNRIVFHQNEISDIKPIDIGNLISSEIQSLLGDRRFSMKAKLKIENVLSTNINKHSNYGDILAISNLGILFEPDLKIDIVNILDKFSIGNTLFVKWDGEINSNELFFLSKQNGIKLELKNISYIVI